MTTVNISSLKMTPTFWSTSTEPDRGSFITLSNGWLILATNTSSALEYYISKDGGVEWTLLSTLTLTCTSPKISITPMENTQFGAIVNYYVSGILNVKHFILDAVGTGSIVNQVTLSTNFNMLDLHYNPVNKTSYIAHYNSPLYIYKLTPTSYEQVGSISGNNYLHASTVFNGELYLFLEEFDVTNHRHRVVRVQSNHTMTTSTLETITSFAGEVESYVSLLRYGNSLVYMLRSTKHMTGYRKIYTMNNTTKAWTGPTYEELTTYDVRFMMPNGGYLYTKTASPNTIFEISAALDNEQQVVTKYAGSQYYINYDPYRVTQNKTQIIAYYDANNQLVIRHGNNFAFTLSINSFVSDNANFGSFEYTNDYLSIQNIEVKVHNTTVDTISSIQNGSAIVPVSVPSDFWYTLPFTKNTKVEVIVTKSSGTILTYEGYFRRTVGDNVDILTATQAIEHMNSVANGWKTEIEVKIDDLGGTRIGNETLGQLITKITPPDYTDLSNKINNLLNS
jgi:hypothetical protein